MRRIVSFNNVAADGYFADADGDLSWTTPDAARDAEAVESLPNADAILFGRRTYSAFEGFWPSAVGPSGASPDPHSAGRFSAAMRALGVWINEATKIVFSRSLKKVTWNNSRLVSEFDPGVIEALKKEPGKDIMLFGSGSIASLLTQHGLVDEYRFVINPVLLGGGVPWIRGVPERTKLRLLESKAYPSGTVSLRYAPVR